MGKEYLARFFFVDQSSRWCYIDSTVPEPRILIRFSIEFFDPGSLVSFCSFFSELAGNLCFCLHYQLLSPYHPHVTRLCLLIGMTSVKDSAQEFCHAGSMSLIEIQTVINFPALL